ncbi:MAG: COG1470 family protein [Armatimonadota bacterium]
MCYRALLLTLVAGALLAAPGWCGPLTITRVSPERICCRPGDTAKIAVDITNSGTAEVTANVALTICYSLDSREKLPGQTVTVPARGTATASFTYPIPKNRKWGHEAVAVLSDESGASLATAGEYFTVGDNPWEVGHYLTLFGLFGRKDNGQIDKEILPRYRRGYVTMIEAYSWQPSVFDAMSPKEDVWREGQGSLKEGKDDWQYLVQQAHNMGMGVVTYIQYFSYGPVGAEFVRRHPDWLRYDDKGRPSGFWFDVDALTKAREDADANVGTPGGFSIGLFPPNLEDKVGQYWIDEMSRSKAMFAWNGFRSDGTPGPVSARDFRGTVQEVKDQDGEQARFIRKIRVELTKRHPDFLFGWNHVVFDPDGNHTGQQSSDAAIPGAYMLWEAFNSAGHPSSVLHNWKRMAHDLQREAEYIRMRGGFSHCGWMPSNRYLEAVVSACGSHTDSWGREAYANYRRFEFRWSEYLWDTALRFVRPGADAVTVEAPARIWWGDFVHARDLPDGGKRVIVHLLNMPEKDDDAWADRPPAPVTNVRVTVAVPTGLKLNKLVAFSPDTPGDMVTAAPNPDGSVTLPQVALWTVVVAELTKK